VLLIANTPPTLATAGRRWRVGNGDEMKRIEQKGTYQAITRTDIDRRRRRQNSSNSTPMKKNKMLMPMAEMIMKRESFRFSELTKRRTNGGGDNLRGGG
jgi:hypothetical protein